MTHPQAWAILAACKFPHSGKRFVAWFLAPCSGGLGGWRVWNLFAIRPIRKRKQGNRSRTFPIPKH